MTINQTLDCKSQIWMNNCWRQMFQPMPKEWLVKCEIAIQAIDFIQLSGNSLISSNSVRQQAVGRLPGDNLLPIWSLLRWQSTKLRIVDSFVNSNCKYRWQWLKNFRWTIFDSNGRSDRWNKNHDSNNSSVKTVRRFGCSPISFDFNVNEFPA